jgi:hypothetical protein
VSIRIDKQAPIGVCEVTAILACKLFYVADCEENGKQIRFVKFTAVDHD